MGKLAERADAAVRRFLLQAADSLRWMLRRWWHFYMESLSNETSARFMVLIGVLWVICPAIGATLAMPSSNPEIHLAFYEIAATIIPVLLLAYFVEHAAMTALIAKGQATAADSEQIRNGEHLLATGRALAALLASHAATGEVLALYAVAHGTSSTFLYVGTLVALASVGAAILLFAVTRIGQPPRR
jgi:hypothetical protein